MYTLKKLKRFYCGSRVASMILYSKITAKRIPISVSFHVTNKCNLRCNYCYSNVNGRYNKNLKDFTTKEIIDLINDMYKSGMRFISILGGEPLLRKDIGEIIKYIKKKNIICELVTNGLLVKKKIEEIKHVDSICFSIDGDEESNDKIRGKGTYKKIIEGVKEASKYKITSRLHAVLSKYNQNCLDHLSDIARENKITYGYSQAIVHDYNADKDFNLSDEDKRKFWKKLYDMKREGHPIYNSNFVLKKLINWPLPYDKIVKEKIDWPENIKFRYVPCFLGKRGAYIDSEGYLYPCICLGIKNGLNVKDVGFKKAWDNLKNFKCECCSYIQYLETNNYLNLNLNSINGALRYFRR